MVWCNFRGISTQAVVCLHAGLQNLSAQGLLPECQAIVFLNLIQIKNDCLVRQAWCPSYKIFYFIPHHLFENSLSNACI